MRLRAGTKGMQRMNRSRLAAAAAAAIALAFACAAGAKVENAKGSTNTAGIPACGRVRPLVTQMGGDVGWVMNDELAAKK